MQKDLFGNIKKIMKKHLLNEKIELHSELWHSHRLNYVNASEIGALMGLSQYSCPAKIFAEKTGILEPWKEGNRFTFWGLKLEDLIAETWEYWDPKGEEDSYVQNYKKGITIRKCKSIKGYIRNPKYEWLSMSLDRVINKGMFKMNGEVTNEEYPLELKNIQSFELNKWETVPPAYLAQIHVQMILMEVDYSELALLDSTHKLHVFPIERNEEFAQQILELTHSFWFEKVIPAKALVVKLNESTDEMERSELQHQINQLEPAPDSSPAYQDFLKEKYKDSYVKDSKTGDMQDWENCINYNKAKEEIKVIEQKQQLYKNNLLASMGTHEFISFESDGQVSNSPNKNGVRTFRISLKN